MKEITDTMKIALTQVRIRQPTEKSAGYPSNEYVIGHADQVADSTAGDDPVLIAGHEMWSGPLLDLGGLGNSSR